MVVENRSEDLELQLAVSHNSRLKRPLAFLPLPDFSDFALHQDLVRQRLGDSFSNDIDNSKVASTLDGLIPDGHRNFVVRAGMAVYRKTLVQFFNLAVEISCLPPSLKDWAKKRYFAETIYGKNGRDITSVERGLTTSTSLLYDIRPRSPGIYLPSTAREIGAVVVNSLTDDLVLAREENGLHGLGELEARIAKIKGDLTLS